MNRLSSFVRKVARALTPPVRRNVRTDAAPDAPPLTVRTRLIASPGANGLKISYAPDADGDADAGEIVWTFPKDADVAIEFACNVPGHYQSGMVGSVAIDH